MKKTLTIVLITITIIVILPFVGRRFVVQAYQSIFQYAEDAVRATGNFGMALIGFRKDTASTTPETSADGDWTFWAFNKYGAGRVEQYHATSSIVRPTNLDITYDTASESATTTFNTSGFRECSYLHTISSTGASTQEIDLKVYHVSGSNYFEYPEWKWARNFYDDLQTVASTSQSDSFPASPTGEAAIVWRCNANCTTSNKFHVANSEIACTN